MERGFFYTFIRVFLFSIACHGSMGQNSEPTAALKVYSDKVFQEKIFAHTDRTFYLTGDYLWFRVYLVDASTHRLTDLSKIAYAELVGSGDQVVLQAKVKIAGGLGNGSLFLPSTIPTGKYYLRIYTRWMRNFDPGFYFNREITVVNPFRSRDNKTFQPAKTKYDLQFFPEGGGLVKGINSRIGFRMTNENGKGIDFTGTLVNARGESVKTFRSMRFGIGSFDFTPVLTEGYEIVVQVQDGQRLKFSLPAIAESGYVMRVTRKGDAFNIEVSSTGVTKAPVTLVVQGRGMIVSKETRQLHDGSAEFYLSRGNLPDGISQITLFDESNIPVSERLVFIKPGTSWSIKPEINAVNQETRKAVELVISAIDNANKPVESNLSLSVFKIDSLQGIDQLSITTALLLTGDLHGTVESPEFYMGRDSLADAAADNLMLTHGWRRFVWKDVLTKKPFKPKYVPENNGHIILGSAANQSGDSIPGLLTCLSIPGKEFKLVGARSSLRGRLQYEIADFYGPSHLFVDPYLRKDSLCRITIESPFSEKFAGPKPGSLVIPFSNEKLLLEKSKNMQLENIYFEKERSRRIATLHDSIPFYQHADEQYYLDRYTRFPTLEDVLREYVPGVFVYRKNNHFSLSVRDAAMQQAFSEDPLILLDGAPIFDTDLMMDYDPLKIKRLDVVLHRYFRGPLTFPGIVSFTTYQGKLSNELVTHHAISMEYKGMEWEREFYSPVYDTPEQAGSRIPDFRNLLKWVPDGYTGKDGKFRTVIYTSDQPGNYVGVINALSINGKPAHASFTFSVSPPTR